MGQACPVLPCRLLFTRNNAALPASRTPPGFTDRAAVTCLSHIPGLHSSKWHAACSSPYYHQQAAPPCLPPSETFDALPAEAEDTTRLDAAGSDDLLVDNTMDGLEAPPELPVGGSSPLQQLQEVSVAKTPGGNSASTVQAPAAEPRSPPRSTRSWGNAIPGVIPGRGQRQQQVL